jgi:hypothetical protein
MAQMMPPELLLELSPNLPPEAATHSLTADLPPQYAALQAGMPAAERALVVHNGDPAGYTAAALVDALGLTDTQHDWAGRACRAVDVRQVEGALCPAELAMGRKVIFLQVALFHILGIIK